MKIIQCASTPDQRANLIKLADYLESLPNDYQHFKMARFFDHHGKCDLTEKLDENVRRIAGGYNPDELFYANAPKEFLNICGTVACALGHGPAAGIPFTESDLEKHIFDDVEIIVEVDFVNYAEKFTHDKDAWDWMFSENWASVDNHHYGAAARIRFLLDEGWVPGHETDEIPEGATKCEIGAVGLYAKYRIDKAK